MATPLNFRHLYYFWIVAKEGGIARAADRLDMAVQTVSAQVRALEQSLGHALFKPSGRSIVLTEAGEAAMAHADQIFQIGNSPLTVDPITNAVSTSYEQQISSAYGEIQSAAAQAVDQYRKIAAAQPKDPSVQLELAQAAQSANDVTTAIAAYKKFLVLAPTDPTAPEVRRLLKQLQRFGATG